MTNYNIELLPCEWEEIGHLVSDYVIANNIVVESYWEDHVLESRHYKIVSDGNIAGYFAINNGSEIWLFNVSPKYAGMSQELFFRVKKHENVTCARVKTGDEFFLSHCIDDFSRIEKDGIKLVSQSVEVKKGTIYEGIKNNIERERNYTITYDTWTVEEVVDKIYDEFAVRDWEGKILQLREAQYTQNNLPPRRKIKSIIEKSMQEV